MRGKSWIVILTALLLAFGSSFCLADQKPVKQAPNAPSRQSVPQVKQQPQQRRPGTPSPGAPQTKANNPQAPQSAPGGSAKENNPAPGPQARITPEHSKPDPQAGPKTQLKEGATHPVEKERVHEEMRRPVTRENQRLAVERYHEERARFARPIEAIRFRPEHRVLLTRVRIVPATYYYRRAPLL